MRYLLLHYVDETAEYDAEVSREGRALLASWLEDTIARGRAQRMAWYGRCQSDGSPLSRPRAAVSQRQATGSADELRHGRDIHAL